MTKERKFNWAYFILGLLFIFVALMAFQDPASDLVAVVLFFSVLAILKGIFELFVRSKVKEYTGAKSTSLIILGILDLVFGIFLLFNMQAGLVALPYIFAVWFIIDSIWELFISGSFKEISKGYYWFMIVINILGIIIGLCLLFNPLTSALTLAFLVGCYFMVSGICYLIAAF
ncbi:MAG: DUF308 domain-containing protein [Lactobacillales bacterium]|jgi:uncharacterized membrane protein HdeD (DUF308 family)|nr:DUF308 domain-containing protein [Lactobacillales bacterium]